MLHCWYKYVEASFILWNVTVGSWVAANPARHARGALSDLCAPSLLDRYGDHLFPRLPPCSTTERVQNEILSREQSVRLLKLLSGREKS